MPIYAYRCTSCGHAKDVLQKVSDPLLTDCPACGAPTFVKQVTAAGFQLKGSGWYVTDFRGGSNAAGKAADGEGSKDKAAEGGEKTGDKAGDRAADKPADPAAGKAAGGASAAAAVPAAAPSSAPAPPTAAAPPSSGG
ncbi:MAG: zinc ribbon domain-containing protein [Rubrivivax sp.]|nr:zinc ribbon domain-containing protein [Rubrivivax sp.]